MGGSGDQGVGAPSDDGSAVEIAMRDCGGDGLIRTGYTYDGNSLQSSMIDDRGNVTLYLYDNLNRKVDETKGLTVGSTLNSATILGPRVVPTPTALPATAATSGVSRRASACRKRTIGSPSPPP